MAYGGGLAWTGPDGAAGSLAGLRPQRVEVRTEREDASEVAFALRYTVAAAGCDAIAVHYRMTDDTLVVEERFAGAPSAQETLAFTWPFPLDDGRDRAQVTVEGGTLRVRLGASTQEVAVQRGALAVAPGRVAHRSGYAGIARSAVADGGAGSGQDDAVTWRLRYGPG